MRTSNRRNKPCNKQLNNDKTDDGSYWKVSYKENELSVCFNVEKKLCKTEAEVVDYVKRLIRADIAKKQIANRKI
jgi:hypothetical protein|nr:MAG TPA: hypothetical protein [Caudoviricetes sp.]